MPHHSFLPEDYLVQRAERRTSMMSLTLFIVVMTAVVGAFFVTNRQWTMVKVEQRDINRRYADAARQIEELVQLERQKTQLVERAEVAAALVERVPRSILLAELINRMPDAVSLQEFDLRSTREQVRRPAEPASQVKSISQNRGRTGGPTREQQAAEQKIEVPVFQVTIALVGLAPTDGHVAEYLTRLGQCALFRDVDLKFTRETQVEGQTLRTFRIEALLHPQADAKQFEPLRLRRTLRDGPERGFEFQTFDPSLIEIDLGDDGEDW
jgi:Tfp pilus assembly protein PilN